VLSARYSNPPIFSWWLFIYCAGKTTEQLIDIVEAMVSSGRSILATRATKEMAEAILSMLPQAVHHRLARCVVYQPTPPPQSQGRILVIARGTSDLPIAEEVVLTARFYGHPTELIGDVGVAGIHRLFDKMNEILTARVIVVVAGMEGALPSVVGGLVKVPVIAVPTSVGHGANFGGLAPLLTMLNSCAAGIAVVNIDNGFGAGYLAGLINTET
jgi:hypothetical protein